MMGSQIEINDTLKLTQAEGLPSAPELGLVYAFCKSERRLYHLKPVRVFLVEDRDGLWNFIGHAQILELMIDADKDQTSGRFVISKLYSPEETAMLNRTEAPNGKGLPV